MPMNWGVDPDKGKVYVGRNSDDMVAALGDKGWSGKGLLFGAGMGNDPSEDTFGAVRFEAEDPTRTGRSGTAQHSLCFDPDSESLYNIGRIVDGSGRVNTAEHIHDPFWGSRTHLEKDREPTQGEEDRSDTGGWEY